MGLEDKCFNCDKPKADHTLISEDERGPFERRSCPVPGAEGLGCYWTPIRRLFSESRPSAASEPATKTRGERPYRLILEEVESGVPGGNVRIRDARVTSQNEKTFQVLEDATNEMLLLTSEEFEWLYGAMGRLRRSRGVEPGDGTEVEVKDTRMTGCPPCPFCDGEPRMFKMLRAGHLAAESEAHAFFVRCNSCAATGRWGKSTGTALRNWSTRAK